MAYDQIIDAIDEGKIKGLWIIATNGAHSWIDQNRYNELMKKLDFLVVQDMFHTTESAQQADLVLPAAGWGEKDGTLINSERRIGLIKKVSRAPGVALSDFAIFKLVAHSWGCDDLFKQWGTPEEAFQLLKQISHHMPYEITGITDYHMIDVQGGIQWPYKAEELGHQDQERRLFEDGRFFTPTGRAKLIFEMPRPMSEATDAAFPFLLMTGRGTSSQWHTNTRTGKSDVLRKLYPKRCYVEVHPDDASRLGISANDSVIISSRRDSVQAKVFVTPSVGEGQLFMPMHYRETNRLTLSSFDRYSRQPSYKACSVALSPLSKSKG
jgi:assimilatory nitrate reductase catalytic subunit